MMAGDQTTIKSPRVLWKPTSQDTRLDQFRRTINKKYGLSLGDYWDLHEWSVTHYPEFWKEIWDNFDIIHSKPYEEVVDTSTKFEDIPEWFRGARLNYAENVLRYNDDRVAFNVAGETKPDVEKVTYARLRADVAEYAAAMKKAGLQSGDRVVGYITNSLPAAEAMLAATSLGCVWSAVSLEFGVLGVLDRLQQIKPKILFTIDYAIMNGKATDILTKIKSIVKELPTVEKVVVVPFNADSPEDISDLPNSCLLSEFLASGRLPDGSVPPLQFVQLPFSHPAFISYTSGTTGLPKPIVHSGGGAIIQCVKEFILHQELGRDDVMQLFATVGWVAWNLLITYLVTGGTVLLYNGSPFAPKTRIWDLVDRLGTTIMWLYPFVLDKLEADGVKPRHTHKLTTLRHILMGASCPKPQNWDYILRDVKPDVHVMSVSGATDIMGLFGGYNLTLPVLYGEIASPSLGMALECYDDTGKSSVNVKGELVLTKPFPSMPLYFWNDTNKEKFKKTYFSKFPGVWSQGDLIMINPVTRGIITLGRSDAVLNPKGRRFGSTEIYSVVETIRGIQDSVCVAQYNKDGNERVVLFLKMLPGHLFTEDLVESVKNSIKTNLTEKHCPEIILEAKDIPYTVTGKKIELAVKKAVNGEEVSYKKSIVNPESLRAYYNIPELKGF